MHHVTTSLFKYGMATVQMQTVEAMGNSHHMEHLSCHSLDYYATEYG